MTSTGAIRHAGFVFARLCRETARMVQIRFWHLTCMGSVQMRMRSAHHNGRKPKYLESFGSSEVLQFNALHVFVPPQCLTITYMLTSPVCPADTHRGTRPSRGGQPRADLRGIFFVLGVRRCCDDYFPGLQLLLFFVLFLYLLIIMCRNAQH